MIDLFAIMFSTGMVLLVIVRAVRLELKQDRDSEAEKAPILRASRPS
jgi:hypothetical protein